MDYQKVFDKAKESLLAQGKPGVINGKCSYGGPNNAARCAIGLLLGEQPQEVLGFDGDVRDLLDCFPYLNITLEVENKDDMHFLNELQIAHDSLVEDKTPCDDSFDELVECNFNELAATWGLES